MDPRLRKTLIAGAIAALISSPAWAAGDAAEYPDQGAQAETGQPMDTAPQLGTAPDIDNPLYSLTPEELQGMEVVDAADESIGHVKTVVLGPERESAHVVISEGGLLEFGAREVAISLDELQQKEDKLQISASKAEFEGRAEYTPEEYVELEPDRPISEFSAFEDVVPGVPDPASEPTGPEKP